jgi:hypothetical protein
VKKHIFRLSGQSPDVSDRFEHLAKIRALDWRSRISRGTGERLPRGFHIQVSHGPHGWRTAYSSY